MKNKLTCRVPLFLTCLLIGTAYGEVNDLKIKTTIINETPTVQLQWSSQANKSYTVECSNELTIWSILKANLFGINAPIEFNVPINPLINKKFYRVVESDQFNFDLTSLPLVDIGNQWSYQVIVTENGSVMDTYVENQTTARISVKNGYPVIELEKKKSGVPIATIYYLNDFSSAVSEVGSNEGGEINFNTPPYPILLNTFTFGHQVIVGVSNNNGTSNIMRTLTIEPSLTVPAGTYTNLIRSESVFSQNLGFFTFVVRSISWVDIDTGFVKTRFQIDIPEENRSTVLDAELLSFTPAGS